MANDNAPSVAENPISQSSAGKSPRFLTWAALVVCVALVVDCLVFRFLQQGTLRGIDFFLLAAAAAYLVLFLLDRAHVWSLAILSLCLTAVLIEAAFTIVGARGGFPWHLWPPRLHRELTPVDLKGVAPRATFTTNSFGIRGKEFSHDDTLRVLCVGGSTTECFYLDDSKTWPHLLGEKLSSRGPVWVGNAGRSGLMALDHVTYLTNAPEADHADIWIVLVGINDMTYRLAGIYDDFAARTWERTFIYRRPGLGGALRRPFHRNLHLVSALDEFRRFVEHRVFGVGSGAFQDPRADWTRRMQQERSAGVVTDEAPDFAAYLDEYRGQIESLISLSRSRGKRLILLTQPTLYADPMPAEHESLTLGAKMSDGRYLSSRQLFRIMESYNDVLRDLAKKQEVECVDLARMLPRSTETFYDNCHFNESGARRLAEVIAPILVAP